jgi:VWFA-related protein
VKRLPRVAIALAASTALVLADEPPRKTSYEEQVKIDLVQVEVTAWPADGNAESCSDLTADDFELTVNRRERRIVAVDRVATAAQAVSGERSTPATPGAPAMSVVLFFDLWHLNVFSSDYTCPMTRPLAFSEARRFVREELRPGDRLLLVTFGGWPQAHYGWLRDRDEALAAIDRLETSPAVVRARREHMHHLRWIEGLKSLLLALGRYPGRKDLIYLGDDFRFDDVALSFYDLAARAQSNAVVVSAVDLLVSCRMVPGPECCSPVPCAGGGLACTPFKTPLALVPIAHDLGGRLFSDASISRAVHQLREMYGCRYLVSFQSAPGEVGRAHPTIGITLKRKGLSLQAPLSFQDPRDAPKERDQQEALFLLPQFGRGLALEAGLWPLRPQAQGKSKKNKGKRWSGLMLARLSHDPAEPWPDGEVHQVVVQAIAHQGSRIYGQFRRVIEGPALERLRQASAPELLVFPVDNLRPGEASITVQATADHPGIAANARADTTIPDPPGVGQIRPWFLVDRLARVEATVTLLPSLEGLLPDGNAAMFVGYGCPGPSPTALTGVSGMLRPASGAPPVACPVEWLDDAHTGASCGWLVARPAAPLTAGLWTFVPPASAAGDADPLDFRVVARD